MIIDSLSFSRAGDESSISQDYDLIFGPYNRVRNFDDDIYYMDELVLIYDRFFQNPPKEIGFEEYLQLPHVAMVTETDKNIFSYALGFEKDPRNIIMHIASPKSAVPLLQDKYVLTSTTTMAKVLDLNYIPFAFKQFPEVPVKAVYPSRLKCDAKNMWIRQVFKKTIMETLKAYGVPK